MTKSIDILNISFIFSLSPVETLSLKPGSTTKIFVSVFPKFASFMYNER